MRIVNGDDFGLNEGCSLAIAEALQRGMITNTTMMATGEYFSEAVRLAKAQGFTDRIGVHFNLTEGRPLTEEILSVGAFVRDGRFHKEYLSRPRPLTEREENAVIRELSAQVERIADAGIRVRNADSHHYIHTFLYLAPLAARVCRAYGITRVRINRTFSTPERPIITERRIDNAWWREQGFVTTSRFGRLSDISSGAFPDDTEIMVHPDYDRNGALIDRTRVENGCPAGDMLAVPDYD